MSHDTSYLPMHPQIEASPSNHHQQNHLRQNTVTGDRAQPETALQKEIQPGNTAISSVAETLRKLGTFALRDGLPRAKFLV